MVWDILTPFEIGYDKPRASLEGKRKSQRLVIHPVS